MHRLRFQRELVCALLLGHTLLALADRADQHDATATRLANDLKDRIKAQLRAGRFDSNALSDELKQNYIRVSAVLGSRLRNL
jgi:hypothetical protein